MHRKIHIYLQTFKQKQMKKIQTVLLTLLVACMGMVVQSCSNDEMKVRVYYGYDATGLRVVSGHESTGTAFINDLNNAITSMQDQNVTDAQVIQKVQTVVDKYNNDVISGTLLLKSGALPSTENMSTIKTFLMTLNPQYLAQ